MKPLRTSYGKGEAASPAVPYHRRIAVEVKLMHTLQILKGLGPLDAKTVGRDSLLRGVIGLPLLIALLTRLVVPILAQQIGVATGFDVSAYQTPIMSAALLLIAPTICGLVIGFLLLDQRDDRTLAALQVTPLPPRAYLAYRLVTPLLLSIFMTVVAFPLAGLADAGIPAVLLAALTAAPLAALVALGLATFAENKVQGLALLKGCSVLLFAPIAAIFVPAPWQWALGVAPTFWPAQLYRALGAGEPGWWIYLLAGLAYQALLLAALLRHFERAMYR
jgi:fluoroquinolone transport system permease protein